MFCDETKIKVIAGKGGDGSVNFRREKFVPKGGPDGGDGGKGGNIIILADENINTLSDINSQKHYRAESGENGKKKKMSGKGGKDLILKVPVGTVIWNSEKTMIIIDLNKNGQAFTIAKGGKGGLGNQHFASSVHQSPTFAENGEPGEEKEIILELKMVADLGLIGMPSAGKSTLISHISNARPKIADYEFTTLIPNLGVVDLAHFGGSHSDSFVVADIPGLIEGAHQGKGLGHKFLKHISRTSVLIHMIDPLRGNPADNFIKIQRELELFDKNLVKKPLIVAINKIDAVREQDLKKIEEELKSIFQKKSQNKKSKLLPQKTQPFSSKIFRISAVTGAGLKELLFEALKKIKEYKSKTIKKEEKTQKIKSKEIPVLKPHETLVKFKIEKVIKHKDHKVYVITGKRIEQLISMTDTNNPEGVQRLYHFFNKMGILRALKREKISFNDIIEIANKKIPYICK